MASLVYERENSPPAAPHSQDRILQTSRSKRSCTEIIPVVLLMAKRSPASGLSSYFTASGTASARATNDPKRTRGVKGSLVRHVSTQQPSLQMFVLDGWGLGDFGTAGWCLLRVLDGFPTHSVLVW